MQQNIGIIQGLWRLGLPKLESLYGVPIIRIVIFWAALYWGPFFMEESGWYKSHIMKFRGLGFKPFHKNRGYQILSVILVQALSQGFSKCIIRSVVGIDRVLGLLGA